MFYLEIIQIILLPNKEFVIIFDIIHLSNKMLLKGKAKKNKYYL